MTALTFEQIETDCINVTNKALAYSPLAGASFLVLLATGCRIGELTNLQLWSQLPDTNYELQTIKRGGIRSINNDFDSTEFPYYVNNKPFGNFMLSKERLRSLWHQFTMYPSAMVKDKQISIHIFRHYRIKKYYFDGSSTNDIKTIFGYSESDTVTYYNDSIIYLP